MWETLWGPVNLDSVTLAVIRADLRRARRAAFDPDLAVAKVAAATISRCKDWLGHFEVER